MKSLLTALTLCVVFSFIFIACSKNKSEINAVAMSASSSGNSSSYVTIPIDSNSTAYIQSVKDSSLSYSIRNYFDSANLNLNKLRTEFGLDSLKRGDFDFKNLFISHLDTMLNP